MSGNIPPLLPPPGITPGNVESPSRVYTILNDNTNNTSTKNVISIVAVEDLPQLLDFRGSSRVTNVLEFYIKDFSSWNNREFWYSAEVDGETNSITFTLANFDKPLSFVLDEISSIIGLNYSENYVSAPTKETVRACLATLGLVDKKNPKLSSTALVNSYPLKVIYFSPIWMVVMLYVVKCLGGMQGSHDRLTINQQVIAYILIWGLDVDIGNIIFSELVAKLQSRKKGRLPNAYYTRFISLVIEHLLGENYHSNKRLTFKPLTISAISFKTSSTSEVALTSHMLKVAKISNVPKETLMCLFF
nr:hypothetical protein [Tanacetum cinerariifolium]